MYIFFLTLVGVNLTWVERCDGRIALLIIISLPQGSDFIGMAEVGHEEKAVVRMYQYEVYTPITSRWLYLGIV